MLPVMAPGRGHAPTSVHPSQLTGPRYSRSPATAYTASADAAIAWMFPGSVISRQDAPPLCVAQMCPVLCWSYSHPSARPANTTRFTCGVREAPLSSQTLGACISDQCAPPSAVTASRARRARPTPRLAPPSATPQVGDVKLAAAGWKPCASRKHL
jgi:hypothetical protein